MGLQSHTQVQVAGRTTRDPRASLAGQPDPLAIAHTARDLDVEVAPVAEREMASAARCSLLQRTPAEQVLDRYELERQRQRVAEVLDSAAAGGRAAVGLEACLWAGSAAAVSELYLQDGAISPGVVCDRSRWLAAAGELCPVCGEPMRHTPDVINELAEAVIDEDGSVHHVRAEAGLAAQQVACALRFDLPNRG